MEGAGEVPAALNRLVRVLIRSFYPIEHYLIMNLLIHHPCITEDNLIELAKFDKKQLRAVMSSLQSDKLIKARIRLEETEDGKAAKKQYYFVDYAALVNVAKYKLDHMRRKIETAERESTSRASFVCPGCQKTFTDLEADQLFDMSLAKFLCTYCKQEVEEEATKNTKSEARALLVKYNEQLSPIFTLLREVETTKLASSVLEPDFPDQRNARVKGLGSKTMWSGNSGRNSDLGLYVQGEVIMNIGGTEANGLSGPSKPTKERPQWLVTSTVEGANAEEMMDGGDGRNASKVAAGTSGPKDSTTDVENMNSDIMRTLLVHESKSAATSFLPKASTLVQSQQTLYGKETSDASDDSEDEEPPTKRPNTVSASLPAEDNMSDNGDGDDENAMATVSFQGKRIPYGDITDEMIQNMTGAEKSEYIKKGQDLYADMFD